MEGVTTKMNNFETVIFADIQDEGPCFLCLRDNGELYICTVEKIDDQFLEKDVEIVTEKEAMLFIANASTKARNVILNRTIQN